ncbi:hypothetical protein T492DRAFT_842609 [Pavlovales sp. CCMP2436]|nr:hypothetical protein T492DRAFT_842609 [Pavlovales sp. CCMP2436]
MIRHYLTPTSGSAPQTGGSKAEFSIPCGNLGLHLDPSQTVLSFTINNGNAGPMVLEGGAHTCIQSLNVYFGSVNISSIDEYGALFALVTDFTTDLDSLRSSGTVRGVADFLPTAVATPANIKDSYYSRAGATIAAGGSLMVALPFMSVLGTLAMKAIPLSQLQDSIKIEVKWAVQTNWGTYADAPSTLTGCTVSDIELQISQVRLDGQVEKAMIDSLGGIVHCPTLDYSHFRSTVAPSAGFISMQIPIRVSQACNIFVILRESAVTNGFSRKIISQRTKAGMIDYRFKLGALVIPQTAINCTGSAAEARMELARAFGSGVADAAARSCVFAELFLTDGYALALSLAAFPSSDALSDGVSTRNTHVVFESRISSSNPSCYLDIFVMHEKLIVCQNGLMTTKIKHHVWIKNAIIDLFRSTMVSTMIKNEIMLEFLLDIY